MNIQIKASFKKEILAFTRTKKFIILLCVFVGLGLFSPLMIIGAEAMMNAMDGATSQMGMDMSSFTDMMKDVKALASNGAVSVVGDLASTGILIFLLMINSFAGGEQKKRSVIIPRTSGLSNFAYLSPKFTVYPAAVLGMSILAVIGGSLTSILLFETNDIVWSRVLLGGALLGVYLMMYTCLHLALGTATSRAGMSAAILIAASMLLPEFFTLLGTADIYNPFMLNYIAMRSVEGLATAEEVLATVIIALIIMVIAFFIALFAQNAKKIDNRGNEILI